MASGRRGKRLEREKTQNVFVPCCVMCSKGLSSKQGNQARNPQVLGEALAVVLGLTCTGSTSGRRLRFSIPGHLALSVKLGDAGRVQAPGLHRR